MELAKQSESNPDKKVPGRYMLGINPDVNPEHIALNPKNARNPKNTTKALRELVTRGVLAPVDEAVLNDPVTRVVYLKHMMSRRNGKDRLCVRGDVLKKCTPKIENSNEYGNQNFELIMKKLQSITGTDSFEDVFFTIIDFSDAYQQFKYLTIDEFKASNPPPGSKYNIVVTEIEGKWYQYACMTFGLPDAGDVFIRGSEESLVKHGLMAKSGIYMDDVIMVSPTLEEALEKTVKFCKAFIESGYKINPKKLIPAARSVKFLGRICDRTGIHADNQMIKDLIEDCKVDTPKLVHTYIGKLGFIAQFINIPVELLVEMRKFIVLKHMTAEDRQQAALIKAQIDTYLNKPLPLGYADLNKPFYMQTDASVAGFGGVLFQKVSDTKISIIATFQRTFTATTIKWSIYRKELHAILVAMAKWSHYFGDNPVNIMCDNMAVVHALQGDDTSSDPVVARWVARIREHAFMIWWIKSADNAIADALSRGVTVAALSAWSAQNIAPQLKEITQNATPRTAEIIHSIKSNTEPSTLNQSLSLGDDVVSASTLIMNSLNNKVQPTTKELRDFMDAQPQTINQCVKTTRNLLQQLYSSLQDKKDNNNHPHPTRL
jgi:hypothetical protein